MSLARELAPALEDHPAVELGALPRLPRVRLTAQDRVLICGVTGSGKSRTAKALVRDLERLGRRVVVWDPDREYAATGCERSSVAELLDHPEILDRASYRIAIEPDAEGAEELAEELAALVEDLILPTGDLVLVIEELGALERTRRADAVITQVAIRARKVGVALVCVGQYAIQLATGARRQLSGIVSFRQEAQEDLEALAARTSPDFARRVAELDNGHWCRWQRA